MPEHHGAYHVRTRIRIVSAAREPRTDWHNASFGYTGGGAWTLADGVTCPILRGRIISDRDVVEIEGLGAAPLKLNVRSAKRGDVVKFAAGNLSITIDAADA